MSIFAGPQIQEAPGGNPGINRFPIPYDPPVPTGGFMEPCRPVSIGGFLHSFRQSIHPLPPPSRRPAI